MLPDTPELAASARADLWWERNSSDAEKATAEWIHQYLTGTTPPAADTSAGAVETEDLHLEREVLGSILTRYAFAETIEPEHFALPAHTAILRAWRACGQPHGYNITLHDGKTDTYHVLLAFDGLERQLAATSPHLDPKRTHLLAGAIAAAAPVTDQRDIDRLTTLAARRGA